MGLDVTAYKTVELVKTGEGTDEDWDNPEWTYLYVVECFAAQADGLVTGFYEVERAGEKLPYLAFSYHGYSAWRRYLAEMVGKSPEEVWNEPDPMLPFVELINFADNEGVLGPVTSAKLARNFGDWAERAAQYAGTLPESDREWFIRQYETFAEYFRMASGSGVVKFH